MHLNETAHMNEMIDLPTCATRLDNALADVFTKLQGLADDAALVWAECAKEQRKPSARDLSVLKAKIDALLLDKRACIYGTGVVVEPGELSDKQMFIEWWRLAGSEKTLPLKLNFNQASENFYNYQNMPWFSVPRSIGDRSVAGPYVDLYGSNMYILTFSLPIYFEGRFIGVVGADLPLHRFERVLIANLMRLPNETLLISADGRVVAANTANWVMGDLAGRLLNDVDCHRQKLGDNVLGWSLLSLPQMREQIAA